MVHDDLQYLKEITLHNFDHIHGGAIGICMLPDMSPLINSVKSVPSLLIRFKMNRSTCCKNLSKILAETPWHKNIPRPSIITCKLESNKLHSLSFYIHLTL
jgi:hypothetical protein